MAKIDLQEQSTRPLRQTQPILTEEESESQHLAVQHGTETLQGAATVGAFQDMVGNEIILDALSGISLEPFDGIVGGEISASIVGQPSEAGAFGSNTAMLRIMRDASVNWEDPALARLESIGSGQALPAEQLERFNAAMNHDFSHVRIHAGSDAAQAAHALNAHAFALGAHIFFGSGTFSPGSSRTDRLLAHELTHVMQHDEGRLPNTSGDNDVSHPSDPVEQEAYANEDRVLKQLSDVDAELADGGKDTADVDVPVSQGESVEQTLETTVSETPDQLDATATEATATDGAELMEHSADGASTDFSAGPEAGDDGGEEAEDGTVSFGGMAMRKRDSLGADKTDNKRVMGLISQSRGVAIPDTVAQRMGQVLGHDFSSVRVHVDHHAAEAAEALNAKAFALGADLFFAEGQYQPGTTAGDELIAHELTHVVQHDEGRLDNGSGEGIEVSQTTDMAEIEAESEAANASSALEALATMSVEAEGTEAPTTDLSNESGVAGNVDMGTAMRSEAEGGGADAAAPANPVTDAQAIQDRTPLAERVMSELQLGLQDVPGTERIMESIKGMAEQLFAPKDKAADDQSRELAEEPENEVDRDPSGKLEGGEETGPQEDPRDQLDEETRQGVESLQSALDSAISELTNDAASDSSEEEAGADPIERLKRAVERTNPDELAAQITRRVPNMTPETPGE